MDTKPNDFSVDLGRQVANLSRLNRRFVTKRLGSYGLAGTMHMFILELNLHPGSSQDALSTRFLLDKGNVARRARQLEDMGYIIRNVNQDDRRQYQLYLTDKGKALVPVIRACLHEWSDIIGEGLSNEDRINASRLMAHMTDAATKHLENL